MRLVELDDMEYKQILVSIIKDIDLFCKINDIKYYIEGGTLLGAVRHKGFIPWDDDIDIMMPRKDYERFLNCYNSRNSRYKVISINNSPKYYLTYAKVIDTRTVLKEDCSTDLELGAFVDVFPHDKFTSKEDAVKINRRVKFYRDILLAKNIRIKSSRKFYKNLILTTMKIIGAFWSKGKLIEKIDEISSSQLNERSQVLAPMVSMIDGERSILPVDYFENTTLVEFEGLMLNAPLKWHEFLVSVFGDYMKLPPEEQRVSHHNFKVWLKSDKA